jgi:multicomponent Na+:H+ antiporter subunit E
MVRFLVLVTAWLLLSGEYTLHEPLIAAFGLLSCGSVWWLWRRMSTESPAEGERTLGLKVLTYLPYLVTEIVKSNLAVARIILHPRLPIAPRIVKLHASQRGEAARVLYANSITLTPGTLSCQLQDDTIWVHALNAELAESLRDGEMDKRVRAIEKDPA